MEHVAADFDYSQDTCDIEKWRNHLIESCRSGNLENVKRVIGKNFSIYVRERAETSPLIAAIEGKHDEVVNILLEIYERDLVELAATKFSKALVAMKDDQSEELLQTMMSEPSGVVVPVLLKSGNHDKPTVGYLSKKKRRKSDRSIEFAHNLKVKNGICDIDLMSKPACPCPNPYCYEYFDSTSALQLTLKQKNDVLARRLLAIPTISDKDYHRNFDLKLGLRHGNSEVIKLLTPEIVASDLSILKSTFENQNFEPLLLVVELMMKTEKYSLDAILELEHFKKVENFADAYLRLRFIRHFKLSFEQFEGFTRSKDDECNILHLLLKDDKESRKVDIAKDLIESYPKLLTQPDFLQRIPIFYALQHFGNVEEIDRQLQTDLVKFFYDKTAEQKGTTEVFSEIDERFLDDIVRNGTGKLFALEHSEVVAVLQKVFNEKLGSTLEQHGLPFIPQLLDQHPINSEVKPTELFMKFMVEQDLVPFDLNEPQNNSRSEFRMNHYQRLLKKSGLGTEALKFFIEIQAPNLNECDSDGKTTFMYFCECCNDNELIKSLILKDPECVTKSTKNGRNCLLFLNGYQKSQQAELLHILLNAGADPHKVEDSGKKPIDEAAMCYDKDTFTILLQLEIEGKPIADWPLRIKKYVERFLNCDGYSVALWQRFCDFLDIACKNENEGRNILTKILETSTHEIYLESVPIETWRETLNKKDGEGNTLLSKMFESCYNISEEHLKKVFELFYGDMDFETVNNNKESIACSIAHGLYGLRNLFEFYPKLLQTLNDHANDQTDIPYKNTPFTVNFDEACYRHFDLFVKSFSLENLKKNSEYILERSIELFEDVDLGKVLMHLFNEHPDFVDENEPFLLDCVNKIYKVKDFTVLLNAISNKTLAKVSLDNSNVLHLLCQGNNVKIIDLAITYLSEEQFNSLKEQQNKEKQKPFDLLNYENKATFERIFK